MKKLLNAIVKLIVSVPFVLGLILLCIKLFNLESQINSRVTPWLFYYFILTLPVAVCYFLYRKLKKDSFLKENTEFRLLTTLVCATPLIFYYYPIFVEGFCAAGSNYRLISSVYTNFMPQGVILWAFVIFSFYVLLKKGKENSLASPENKKFNAAFVCGIVLFIAVILDIFAAANMSHIFSSAPSVSENAANLLRMNFFTMSGSTAFLTVIPVVFGYFYIDKIKKEGFFLKGNGWYDIFTVITLAVFIYTLLGFLPVTKERCMTAAVTLGVFILPCIPFIVCYLFSELLKKRPKAGEIFRFIAITALALVALGLLYLVMSYASYWAYTVSKF